MTPEWQRRSGSWRLDYLRWQLQISTTRAMVWASPTAFIARTFLEKPIGCKYDASGSSIPCVDHLSVCYCKHHSPTPISQQASLKLLPYGPVPTGLHCYCSAKFPRSLELVVKRTMSLNKIHLWIRRPAGSWSLNSLNKNWSMGSIWSPYGRRLAAARGWPCLDCCWMAESCCRRVLINLYFGSFDISNPLKLNLQTSSLEQ